MRRKPAELGGCAPRLKNRNIPRRSAEEPRHRPGRRDLGGCRPVICHFNHEPEEAIVLGGRPAHGSGRTA